MVSEFFVLRIVVTGGKNTKSDDWILHIVLYMKMK